MSAVIARISDAHIKAHVPSYVRGQSLGCIVALKGSNLTMEHLTRVFNTLTESGKSNLVSVQIMGSHTNIGLHCFSVTFHFPMGSKPAATKAIERSIVKIREWLDAQFGVGQVEMKQFKSRIQLCNYTRTFLAVI